MVTSHTPGLLTASRRARFAVCSLLLIISAAGLRAQPARVYIANDDHTDLMWSSDEAGYRAAWNTMLDYYLDQADQTDTAASDFQGRFNTDGHYWVWNYEQTRSGAQFQRLIDRIRSGHITMPLQTLVMIYGGMSVEAVLRSMYYAGRLERRFDLRFHLVSAMENQTLPWGLPSLWAGAGGKYSWKGVCACATNVPGLGNRGRELYHAQGPDGRSVLMKWYSLYPGDNRHSGGYAETRTAGPAAMVDFAATDATFRSRQPDPNVVGFFGWGWDDLSTTTSTFITAARSRTTPSRRVIVSNETDFFQDVEATVPAGLIPTFSATFGNDWDCNVATMAEVTAGVKRAVEKLRTAEALASAVSLVTPSFMTPRTPSRDSAWNNIGLYFEHNWNNDGAFSHLRPAYNRAKASQIARYVNSLATDAALALGAHIPAVPGTERFFVFNPLGWIRTDVADHPWSGPVPVRVIDAGTGALVRSQLISRDGRQYIRILATDVPSLGYRVYEVRQESPGSFDSAATFSAGNTTFENGLYRVTLNGRAAITSLVRKGTPDREWVQSIGGRAMNDPGSGTGTPQPENAGPVSATLLVTSSGTLPHTSRVTLFKDIDRVEIENVITANFFGDPPVYYGFGVNLSGQTTRHEELGAVAVAKLTTGGGQYSPASARYDYLTMNHFVDMSDASRGITLSNWDSQFFQLGASTLATLDVTTPQIKAIVGGKLAPATNGFGGQDGDASFLNRYALRTHGGYDQGSAMRFALEHQNPFTTGAVTGGTAALPPFSFSLATVSTPDVLLWAFKPADDGMQEGFVVRLWNLAGTTREFTLSLFSPLTGAYEATHLETATGPAVIAGGALTGTLPTQQLQSYRLLPGPLQQNQAPDVLLTSPPDGALFTAPASITLAAAASDSDGTVAFVHFLRDSVILATDSSAPYTVQLDSVGPGTYAFAALAVDNRGAAGSSPPAHVTVQTNLAPVVTLTAPMPGARYKAPAAITLTAAAADSDGTVGRVLFYQDALLVAVDSTPPYTVLLEQVGPGRPSFRAVAVDSAGASAASPEVLVLVLGGSLTLPIPVASGWNLTSLPLATASDSVSAVFPAATSWWEYIPFVGYAPFQQMRRGIGYWMKFPGPASVDVTGGLGAEDTVAALPGWSLLGSAGLPLPVGQLRTIPAGLLSPQIFGYANGYVAADSVFPGRGYWVKLLDTALVVLSIAPVEGVEAAPPTPPFQELLFTDARGMQAVLRFTRDVEAAARCAVWTLPPPPPAGILDVRFADDRYVAELPADRATGIPILVASAVPPLTVSWSLDDPEWCALRIDDREHPLHGTGTLVVPDHLSLVLLGRPTADHATDPTAFALEANYPNPFNPVTSIRYALPTHAHVHLQVFDILGRPVADILDGRREPGYHSITWDARSSTERVLASGVYILRMDIRPDGADQDHVALSRKMVLLR